MVVRNVMVVLALGATALLWATVSAQQEVRSTPGLGSGIVTVRGTVDVGNVPGVIASQGGDWRVAVSNEPTVIVKGPDFAIRGGRYSVVWLTGETETVTIAAAAQGGWAQVHQPQGQGQGPRRWVNLAAARSVEEVP